MQTYFDPSREASPTALPDCEVFFVGAAEIIECGWESAHDLAAENGIIYGEIAHRRAVEAELEGWYWQACFPGCLPDSEPSGPFASEAEALEDARDGYLD